MDERFHFEILVSDSASCTSFNLLTKMLRLPHAEGITACRWIFQITCACADSTVYYQLDRLP